MNDSLSPRPIPREEQNSLTMLTNFDSVISVDPWPIGGKREEGEGPLTHILDFLAKVAVKFAAPHD